MKYIRRYQHCNKILSACLLLAFICSDLSILFLYGPKIVHAAQVQIDTLASNTEDEHKITGNSSVFISDQVGYKFYVDSTGTCVYNKTTNGGTSWNGAVIVDNQLDCGSPTVWYDQWTPGDAGSYIHIVTQDLGTDDLWYNRLDTSSDTLLLGTTTLEISSALGLTGPITPSSNQPAITKGTDGTIYVGMSDDNGSTIIECTSNCNLIGNWSLTGTDPLDSANDYLLMLPLPSADIMLIRRDVSLNDIQYQIWDDSVGAWPGNTSWSTIDSAAFENTTTDASMAAAIDENFDIFLAYTHATNLTTADHDLRTAKYTSGSWTNTADVTTADAKGLTGVTMALDENTGEVYVAFSARTTITSATTGNVYWATSTSAMSSWSGQSGPVNTTPENILGVDLNHRSDQRIYVSWYGDTSLDVFGDTLADITPQTIVSTIGTQSTSVRASTTAAHAGGVFVIQEFKASRFVNSIEITETGTIDGSTGIGDIELRYDLDTSAPYDCNSVSFSGDEVPFGSVDTNGFSGADGVSVFTDAVTISPTQAMCVYPVVEVIKAAADTSTLEIEITDPSSDVVLSTGLAPIPDTTVAISGTTNIIDDTLTQTHYHWRNDNGTEAAATSRTSGTEDTVLSAVQQQTPIRLRYGVSNEGSTTSLPTAFQLQYSPATGSCDLASGWTNVSNSAVGAVPTVQGFQTTSSGATSVASLNMTAPSGITAGELLMIIVANDDTTGTAQFSNNLSGWNFIGTSGNGTAQAHIGAFWRVANGTEGSVTVDAQSADNMYGWYIRIAGANTANPINVSNFTQSAADSNSRAIPQVVTTSDNTLAVYGLSFDGGDGDPFSISGTGWAEQGELTAGTAGTDGAGVWGTKSVASAGGTVDATVGSAVSDGAAYFQLAINPQVNATGGGDWYMSGSSYLSDGGNTTEIANGIGGVTNENTTLLTPNGGIRTFNSLTGALTLLTTNYVEFEYAIVASTTATQGNTYCFRVTDTGDPNFSYTNYARATIAADVTISTLGSQITTAGITSTNRYIGGAFVITENSSSRNVTSITLTENGSVDGATDLDNIRLYYDLDTSAPYNCASESYGGGESQFGATSTTGFSSANGTSTFSGSVGISTTTTMCVYPVLDITNTAQNDETIDITINSGSADVQVSGGGSRAPSTALDITGSTTLQGSILTQSHYHWRSDNGTEVTASSSVGAEDTPQSEFAKETPIRLRLGIDNTGPTTSVPTNYRLEYGIKISTCENVSVWTDVGASGDAWDMYDSPNLTEGNNTTDITGADFGELTNPGGKSFLASNGGVRDTTSQTGAIVLTNTEFTELEYSITSTATTSYSTNYCFRVTAAGDPLPSYSEYAELTTAAKRDFRVQRGTTTVTGTGVTISAGPTTYIAPASTSLAFVRITNMHHTGAGRTVGDNTQEADDETAYISNSSNLASGFTISRNTTALNNTVVSWEIVEFIGELGTDNEMRVRSVGTTTITGTNTTATGTAVTGISNDSDVVVFITGIANANTGTAYYNGQVTSRWVDGTNEPVFERIGAVSNAQVSYAVVEFTGINWQTQRIEHTYNQIDFTETEIIDNPVNSLSRTFIHTQKRMGAHATQSSFGHLVWLSSMSAVSFKLSPNAATTSGQVSVVWIIENTQTSEGKMVVQQKGDSISGGVEPRTASISINTVSAVNNTSLFAMSAFEENTANFPRVLGGVTLASTTAFQIYNSDITAATPYYYRVEIVQWPTTGLSVRQNYNHFYVNNDLLTPTDGWPAGASDVGDNGLITALDEPVSEGDVVRLRVSLQVNNANLPAGLRTFKLQFAERTGTCTSVETWIDVGAPGSGALWRGYDTPVTDGTAVTGDPATPSELTMYPVSDVAGRFTESYPTVANPYDVNDGDDVEYDFALQHNGAVGSTFYCFRVVNADGETLDGYENYPQLRTAGFTPVTTNWRWYEDEENETPVTSLASENSAPINVPFTGGVALRVNVDEIKNVDGNNVKFKLQYSEHADFATAYDLVATSTCTASSTWCYVQGGGTDNALISSSTLSQNDLCTSGVGDGCGRHNVSDPFVTGHTHQAGAVSEYAFTIQHAGAKPNTVYYFRLYDTTNSSPVVASSSYPSLVTQGAELVFTNSGLPSGTSTEGIVTDVSTASTTVSFGSLPFGVDQEAAYRLNIDTNATEGYQVFMLTDQSLINGYGDPIPAVGGTNPSPVSWSTGCSGLPACFGYHAGDDSLSGGSARFAPDDSYSAFSTSALEEIAYSSVPTNESHDVVFRVRASEMQEAGEYQTGVTFIVIPSY